MTNESLFELVQCKYDVMKYLRHHLATLNLLLSFTLFCCSSASKRKSFQFSRSFVFCWKKFLIFPGVRFFCIFSPKSGFFYAFLYSSIKNECKRHFTVEQSAFMETRAVCLTAFDNRPLKAGFCAQIPRHSGQEFNGPLPKAFH